MSNTKLKMNYITIFIIMLTIAVVLSASGCSGKDTASTPSPTTTESVTITHIETGDLETNAKIVSIIFDKDNYKAGDKVTAILTIHNTGTGEITSENIDITAKLVKLDSTTANLALKALSDDKKTMSYSMVRKIQIPPGETKELSATFTTEKELEGISLAGEYDVVMKVSVNGMDVGSSKLLLKLG